MEPCVGKLQWPSREYWLHRISVAGGTAVMCWVLCATNFCYVQNLYTLLTKNPIIFSGGMAGGTLHALTGPDHLLSILPHVLGQRFWKGFRVGSLWGMGHGLTTCFLGGLAYSLRGSLFDFEYIGALIDVNSFAIGATLIAIGLMGLHESGEYHSMHSKDGKGFVTSSDVVYLAIFLNGLFLGFSWDGLPSLAPTLATTNVETVVAFLAGNFFGTILSIGFFSGVIAEGSSFLSRMSNTTLVWKMCATSSLTAVVIGCGTIVLSLSRQQLFGIFLTIIIVVLLLSVVATATICIGVKSNGFSYQWQRLCVKDKCTSLQCDISSPIFCSTGGFNERMIV